MSLKNRVTPPGIDPWTVRIVAQRLDHYATPGPVRSCTFSLMKSKVIVMEKVKVKVTLREATRAQKGSIALLFP